MGELIKYKTREKIAEITLNRPERFNAICLGLPEELEEAVKRANADESIHAIQLTGAGKAFCSGYDLKEFAEAPTPCPGSQEMPWDPMKDYQLMRKYTDIYMSLFKSPKPVICKINGPAIAGGSDIALCSDIIVMADEATIGYPPVRVWGTPSTAMWVFRLGMEKAKRMLLTGDIINGREAEKLGLVYKSVPYESLDSEVNKLLERISTIPINQLMMQKMMINQLAHNTGLESTQTLANVFDGISRHTPEGVAFKKVCEKEGFKSAIKSRDNL